ncbi:hypothetical protein B1A99_02700 [Cohnella sp. CIP 111063]|uniref:glycosyl hydrolase family 95 catalytic domain-containing protein n=1 Tax=unclassified Cohnella TaxID=2636738 RepID=UPI000B8C5627|nr:MULTISPECIES: hypothetical protein [unclassified Cohnella]OXS62777.1 hypothetical protein B1A99_02700 [Cohnella sp. CIP 111063]PRX75056.1 hypothetical protein B0G52_101555 [Cohnella sp. SGD-V74]
MGRQGDGGIRLETDWVEYLSGHDMDWVVKPVSWDSGAFLGNGFVGAMAYGEEHASMRNTLRFVLGRTDVSAGSAGRTGFDPRVPVGEVHLRLEGWIYQPTSMRLDLWNAELRADITTTKGSVQLRAFVHSEMPVLCIELECSEEERGATIEWAAYSELDQVLKQADGINLNQPIPDTVVTRRTVDRIGVGIQRFESGQGCTTSWTEREGAEGRRSYWIAVVRGCEETDCAEAVRVVREASDLPGDRLVRSHRDWWYSYYRQSFVSIPDSRLESFYWIQMYKLASATRANAPLLDNIGPWLTTTPWPGAWFNMNVQMSYSPVYASNRLELGQSLIGALRRCREQLIANVPEAYRGDSAGLGRSSGLDLKSEVDDEVGNLTWICHSVWRHYRCSMDEELLRDLLYPLLRRSVNYYLHLLEEGEDGRLHLPPTISPEYGSFKRLQVADCHYDLALLRWGCETLLDSAERLGVEDERIGRWREVVERLAPLPTDDTGFRVGKDTPLAFGHRHFSHLLAVFPLHLIRCESSEEWELVNRSLRHWLGLEGDLRGFSFTGAASIAAALGQGELALQCLHTLLHLITPNTMYREAGPVIETPLAGAEAIHDMLLQSWGGVLRIFPAMPAQWRDTAFHELRAEGGFLVSAVREGGETRFVRVKSLAGESCFVRTDLTGRGAVRAVEANHGREDRSDRVAVEESGLIRLDICAGEDIVLYVGERVPDLAVRAVRPSEAPPIRNYFGGRTPWRQYGLGQGCRLSCQSRPPGEQV